VPRQDKEPILILSGPPGSGKTTVAGALAAKRRRAVHLESDRFFHFIQAGAIDPWKPEAHEQNTIVMRIVARAAAGYADAGYLTIIDGIVIPGWFLEPLRDSLAQAGHRVAYTVLRAPLSVCIERARARASGPLADAAVIERLWDQFADLGPFEAQVVERGAQTAEIAADAITARLRTDLVVA
jgi:predicted kinase